MRYLLIICLFLSAITIDAQVDSLSLKQEVMRLDQALVNKDVNALGQLLSADVSYGHSNGWVQTKTDILADLKTGKLDYQKIEDSTIVIVALRNNLATVRTNTNVEVKLNSNTIKIRLHVLEVWVKQEDHWVLLARQATKL